MDNFEDIFLSFIDTLKKLPASSMNQPTLTVVPVEFLRRNGELNSLVITYNNGEFIIDEVDRAGILNFIDSVNSERELLSILPPSDDIGSILIHNSEGERVRYFDVSTL